MTARLPIAQGTVPPPATVSMVSQTILEGPFVDHLIGLAERFGWLVHHDRPARTSRGYRTAIQGHAGFPDLVLVPTPAARAVHRAQVQAHPGETFPTPHTLWREVKTNTGRLRPDQRRWATVLAQNAEDVDVWTPRDYPLIVALLTFRRWSVRPAGTATPALRRAW